MRDHTASRLFRARKALEKTLHRLFPASFMPLYMMISFSRIPYAETVRIARRQSRAIRAAAVAAGAAAVLLVVWLMRGH
jgi:kynurenine 3-monooxygenase